MSSGAEQGDSRQAKATELRALLENDVLVLPNAWDAASAAVMVAAGAKAIATTSGGVSWSLGSPDGEGLDREAMTAQVGRIAEAVNVPVTADVEGGYGPAPEDVAQTVEAVIGVGAVGVNIEDSRAPGGPLFDIAAQGDRLRAARDAAQAAGLGDLVINARTDVILFGIGDPADRVADVLRRAREYKESGVDSLFVPGLVDLDTLAELVKESPLPINVMAGPGAPSVAELQKVGVRRVTVGTAIAQAAYAVAQHAAEELLSAGTYARLDDAVAFGTLNQLVRRDR
jgi:2-methylisocitrate lyase-like PEP mutase family enzyme